MRNICRSDFAAPTFALMTKSQGNFCRGGRAAIARFTSRDEKRDAISTKHGWIHPSTSALTYDEKRLVKKGESIIKLAFYSAEERIERRVPAFYRCGEDGRKRGRIGERRGGI